MKSRFKYFLFLLAILSLFYFFENRSSIYEEAYIIKVLDGDTVRVRLQNGRIKKVRLIGINSPEKGKEKYADEAWLYAKKLMLNKYVYLEKDISDTDQYGRLLRYIWLKQVDKKDLKNIGVYNVSAIMLKNGYARCYTFKPDIKYLDEFKKIEKRAKRKNRGLWDFKEEVTRGNKR